MNKKDVLTVPFFLLHKGRRGEATLYERKGF